MKTLNQDYMNRSAANDLRMLASHLERGLADIVDMDAQKRTKLDYDILAHRKSMAAYEDPDHETGYLGEHKVSFTLRYPGQG